MACFNFPSKVTQISAEPPPISTITALDFVSWKLAAADK